MCTLLWGKDTKEKTKAHLKIARRLLQRAPEEVRRIILRRGHLPRLAVAGCLQLVGGPCCRGRGLPLRPRCLLDVVGDLGLVLIKLHATHFLFCRVDRGCCAFNYAKDDREVVP
eukprot:SAG11_NODE_1178_length_5598_cov_4.168394_5_plen_114_part_00